MAVDPIVESALRHRPPSGEPGGPRHGEERAAQPSGEGGLGWPGEPADGTGLGWPVDLLRAEPSSVQAPTVTLTTEEPPLPRRSGWRRLFGSNAA